MRIRDWSADVCSSDLDDRSRLRGGAMSMTDDDVVVRRQVVVDAPVDRAFALFVERFGDFKPGEHNLLGVPIAETRFEPHVGGHIYDRGETGSECRWARVLADRQSVVEGKGVTVRLDPGGA